MRDRSVASVFLFLILVLVRACAYACASAKPFEVTIAPVFWTRNPGFGWFGSCFGCWYLSGYVDGSVVREVWTSLVCNVDSWMVYIQFGLAAADCAWF